MRIAYLDESGRSRHEPIMVAAGVIVHGDRDYRRIEGALIHLAADVIPEPDRAGFVFHASDIFSGTGYFKDREIWPREARYPILLRLAGIVAAFKLPVVFGHLVKAPYRAEIAASPILAPRAPRVLEEDTDIGEHMSVFAQVEIATEYQMRSYPRDEICMVVAEDTDRVKRGLKEAHSLLRDPGRIAGTEFAAISALPLERVVDTPHFATKAESPLLQLADVCAFLIARRLRRREDSQPFFEVIAPQIFLERTADFGERMGAERIAAGQRH